MPSLYTKRQFIPEYYYHLYNRGAHKQNIFLDNQDYQTFIDILSFYSLYPTGQSKSLLQRTPQPHHIISEPPLHHLVAFCLMPNHFHLLIHQTHPATSKNNVPNFMKRLSVTYAMYFNQKYNHSGGIFQGKYKNVVIKSNSQLIYLTKYIHQNPDSYTTYPYSSCKYYLQAQSTPKWLTINHILEEFSNTNRNLSYKSFLQDSSTFSPAIKNLFLE